MGGMGFIENNKAECMQSVLINTNLLIACKEDKVKKYFFSSSACAYNKSKQQYIISTLSNNKKIINLEILTKLCNKTQSLLKLNNKWQTTSFLPNYVKINNDYYLQEFDFDYVD